VATVQVNAANQAPTAFIDTPSASLAWSVGQHVTFSGHATDPNQAMGASRLRWDLIMAHCPDSCHEHVIGSFSGVAGGSFDAPDHEYPSHLVLRLTATDSHGASDVTEIELHPATRTLSMRSSPSGIELSAAGVTGTTPFNVTVIAGSSVSVAAVPGQVQGGFPYTWSSWSDGGSQSHSVVVSTSRTLTAYYVGGFDDVPPGAPFRADIGWLVTEGITAGCAPALYCPNGLVTRGQMATFLSRALDLPSTSTDFFTDDEGNTHEGAINRLRAAGITAGCAPGRFCPTGLVTRAQMAKFLSRADDLAASSTDYFTDDAGSAHEGAINRLRAAGITSGCSAGPDRFCPDGIVTRAQMAAFIHRAHED
jgi:hypothetical protein